MRRRLVIGALTAALLVGGGVTAALLVAGHGDSGAPSPREAQRLAASACREESRLEQLVRDNASAPAVFKAANRAADEATRATLGDTAWVQLASGLQLLRDALRKDDAAGTAEALGLVRAHCLPDPH